MYSLYDLYLDIRSRKVKEFQYDGHIFSFAGQPFNWTLTQQDTGFTATCRSNLQCMLDLQCVAACLLYYKEPIAFDRNENLVSTH